MTTSFPHHYHHFNPSLSFIPIVVFLFAVCLHCQISNVMSNPDAARLYERILMGYNKLIRPVESDSDKPLRVKLKLRLSQLLDVHEKNQIMTTNVWLKQEWDDFHFRWDPKKYGGVEMLHIPADQIWIPDIVLYNNADGNYQVSIMTKALVAYNGSVVWEPPAIYKSMCEINVQWFPFDEQMCELRFGSWTYDGNEVDLVQYDTAKTVSTIDEKGQNVTRVESGIDIAQFYPSVEWDIMAIPSQRHEVKFECCVSPYIDITFSIYLRRKTLFYTVNLIIPSVGISLLTVMVFYLPSDSGEKVVLCISILISLTWFFLLLVEIIPSTSLVMPLIGLYLLFTMVVVTASIAVTVITLNVHYRAPDTHRLPRWAKRLFIKWLPGILRMRRPNEKGKQGGGGGEGRGDGGGGRGGGDDYKAKLPVLPLSVPKRLQKFCGDMETHLPLPPSPAKQRRLSLLGRRTSGTATWKEIEADATGFGSEDATLIAEHFQRQTHDQRMREDWRYIASVLDRLFLSIFSLVCLTGTCLIILRAPIIYDFRVPLK